MSEIQSKKKQGHRADIDGMRAIAVSAVVLFHVKVPFLSGGFCGVDVFFVLSGFLISRIIFRELENGAFSMVNFWERRIRRIFPALSLVVITTLLAGWFLLLPQDFRYLGQSAFAQSASASNIYFWMVSGYFDQSAEIKPLLHTWSLSVEEQFYLLFPVLLLGLRRVVFPLRVCALAVVWSLSLFWNIWSVNRYPELNFFLLPSRTWELITGALVALAPPHAPSLSGRTSNLLATIGLILVVASFIFINPSMSFPGWVALVPCVGTGLLIWVHGLQKTWVSKFLSYKPVTFLGLISYSLYLWHWPILAFANYWFPEPGATVLINCVIASFLLSAISWKWVETPFRTKKWLPSRFQMLSWGGLFMVLIAAIGMRLHLSDGVKARFSPSTLNIVESIESKSGLQGSIRQNVWTGDLKTLHQEAKDNATLILFGDSHLEATLHVFKEVARDNGINIKGLTLPGALHLGLSSSTKHQGKVDLIDYFMNSVTHLENPNVLMFFNWHSVNDHAERSLLNNIFEKLRSVKSNVWVIKSPPVYQIDLPRFAALSDYAGMEMDLSLPADEIEHQRTFLDSLFNEWTDNEIKYLELMPLFTMPNMKSKFRNDIGIFYSDGDHLSIHGAQQLKPLVHTVMKRIKAYKIEKPSTE